MAIYVGEKDFKRQVRVCLDENKSINTDTLLQDIDTLSLDEIIDSKVEEAALSVIKAAPVTKLGDISKSLKSLPSISKESPYNGEVALPNNFERLVRFKMKSWSHALFVVQQPYTPQWEKAHSGFNVYGTKDRPVVFLVPSEFNGRDLKLEFFCAGSPNDKLDRCLYVARPKKVAPVENVNVGEATTDTNDSQAGNTGSAGNQAGNTGGNSWYNPNVNSGTNNNNDDEPIDDENMPYVDLGLSVKWAKCNIGADSPEKYGDYFAWGETESKENFSKSNYTFNGTELGDDNDAAAAKLGKGWNIPTPEQFQELIDNDNTEFEKCELNGVSGYRFTSRINGKSIFMPFAGKVILDTATSIATYGFYWSNAIDIEDTDKAKVLEIGKTYRTNLSNFSEIKYEKGEIITHIRRHGLPIRPVYVAPVKSVRLRSKSQFEDSQSSEFGGLEQTESKGWQILLGDDLKRATIYYAAYLTALAIKDADAATALLGIAKDLIEN